MGFGVGSARLGQFLGPADLSSGGRIESFFNARLASQSASWVLKMGTPISWNSMGRFDEIAGFVRVNRTANGIVRFIWRAAFFALS
jgi:hypothetical protein